MFKMSLRDRGRGIIETVRESMGKLEEGLKDIERKRRLNLKKYIKKGKKTGKKHA